MTGQTHKKTNLIASPYLEIDYQGEVVRLELTKTEHVLGRNPQQADLLVPKDWEKLSRCQAILRQEGDDYRIYDGDGLKPSSSGLFVLPTETPVTPTQGCVLRHGIELRIGTDLRNPVRVSYFNPGSPALAVLGSRESVSLRNRSVVLGRDRNSTLQLNSPIVSRSHCAIDANKRGDYVLTDKSANGVFINGKRVKNEAILTEGAKIRIGPFLLIYQNEEITVIDPGNAIGLEAINLNRPFVNDISLVIEPGQLVALVGGSGAGKSTLMRTLLGIETTNRGAVYVNGDELRKNFECYSSLIGYVPQDDIVHGELTVTEALTYAIKLRLPPDVDVEQVLTKTLTDIEMLDKRKTLVKDLSGGQRKRVSIGVELLADPKLFFLDEPTSGLDPGLDKKMMELLRNLADKGRTVVLVTHATANVNLCDRLVFLGRNGYLCYFGPPADAANFFGVNQADFANIYNELEIGEKVIKEWANTYRNSAYYQRYITAPLSPKAPQKQAPPVKLPQPAKVSPIKQLFILADRYFKLTLRDPVNVGLGLLTAAVCPILLAGIKDIEPLVTGTADDPALAFLALRILFVFTSAAIWVGLSSSLQEIVKESAVYQRERLVNLGLLPYVGSKFLVLGGLALLQTVLMTAVILIGFKQPSPDIIAWPLGLGITVFLTLLASMSLGLMVSAFVKNGSQANSALPLLLVPQIIFSGVLFSLGSLFKIEKIGQYISWLTVSRWSVGAYGSLVNVNAMVPKPIELPDRTILPQLFEKSAVYEPTWQNLALNWGILGLHAAVYLTVTLLLQKRKDIFK
ncbi:ATP-binding cassette domain-containing protein [Microcoleus sp. PH2017_05_CCC_O_A]|uniref:ATP-binding cassette domain-containing protein n=1 Tax=Microcoleus sp. PH2017_05_CCC_O_A TaxID=2798816 RepID=UPI001D7C0EF8|nr:ATP-binding cassette domain-containing protein [Microcoleus sp. PH2017_05_CCC_O_A]MCC3439744.1 ATP-binding cassette domain-containing protein [Microcoleus sp. PH2017_05_CCC_O_A]TAF94666.1 MAG: ATP-binding cassette domain-containing protein [Oscillatoriales cyanobacterium]TAG59944.1 MAG: ATP-binding cassette domain-containing protein [Oscillatoriales cyanobacterium]